ncbi:MAG: hypothetical protein ACM359_05340, partial [Bacillota bacterium]
GMKQWLRQAAGPLLDGKEKEYLLQRRVGPFAQGAEGLAFWSTMPDLVSLADKRERPIEPFGVSAAKLHYLDLELFMPEPLQRHYADNLSHKPRLTDIPRDIRDERFKTAGMLPFAVEHAYRAMVKNLREGRLDDAPGQYPRDEHAAKWAGYLAHYLEDNTQPHHATEDYKSRSYFNLADPKAAPDVHTDMEYRLVDDEDNDYPELRRELWDQFAKALEEVKDPVRTNDLWQATLEVSLTSYDALPLIGRAAQAAYPELSAHGPGRWDAQAFFHYRGQYLGRPMSVMEMKAYQWAWAVQRVQRVWRQAWEESGRK